MSREIPYGLEAKVFSRSRGESAVEKAAYRAGMRLTDLRTGEIHDYTRKQHVEHREILAPRGAPEWAFKREQLWNRVEAAESRKDAQVARELRLTLPRELSLDQQIALTREWCESQYVSNGMIADFAIHSPPASDGGEQPHAHIMLTMRPLDGDAFSRKKAREWNDLFADADAFKVARRGDKSGSIFVASTGGLESMRAAWAEIENQHLAAAGSDGRVDHRSLADQRASAIARGDLEAAERLNRPAEPKLRPGESRRGNTERTEAVEAIRQYRTEVIDLAAERKRRRRHPDDIRAAAEQPTTAQIHAMEMTNVRIAEARRKLANGGGGPGADRQDDRRHPRPDKRPDGAAGTATGRQSQQSGFAARTGAAAGRAAGGAGEPSGSPARRNRRDQSPEAIARRRERSRRIAEARSSLDTLDSGNQAARDRYKLKLLQQHYQQEMPSEVARDLAWARTRRNEVAVLLRDGGRIRDDGAALRARGRNNDSTLAVMVAAAKSHGWTEIDVSSGSKEFRERSAEALTRAGISVKNADLARVVERTRAVMAAEAQAAEPAFVASELEQAQRQRVAAQRIAADDGWVGPDGIRRPFTMTVAGMHQPVPARLTDEEIRDHLQPGWRSVAEAPADLRDRLETKLAELECLGPFRFAAAGKVRSDGERLLAQLEVAETRASAHDRAWGAMRRDADELRHQAARARQVTLEMRDAAIPQATAHARQVEELQQLHRMLQRMADTKAIQPSPPGFTPAQRLEWLKAQAEKWEKDNPAEAQQQHSRFGFCR
jgi:MobA/MobL family/Large polyvalent protein-associated domain 7